MTARSGLIKDEMAAAKREVEAGITVQEFAMMFSLQPEAAQYWHGYFSGEQAKPASVVGVAPPVQPDNEGQTKASTPKLTPKAKKDKEE